MSRLARTTPAGTRWVSETRPLTPGQDASALVASAAPAADAAITAADATRTEKVMSDAPFPRRSVDGAPRTRAADTKDARVAAHRANARHLRPAPPDSSGR